MESALDDLEAKWGDKYPLVIKSGRQSGQRYRPALTLRSIRHNAVEAVHCQSLKLTKTKDGFANETSLLKLLYAGILKVSERWSHPIQNWSLTLSQLATHFEGRLDDHLEL